MKVIVGLGNPGKKYERTRHNLGFLVLDRLASKSGVAINKEKHQSLTGEWHRDGDKALLVKPQTYMNLSGEALQKLLSFYPVETENVVVIHDDLDLPFGRIRIRQQGSPGGHRGMISVTGVLGEQGFSRVRIGIGRPPPGVEPRNFVLQKFSPEEAARLDEVVSRAVEAVECLVQEGAHRAMEKFNRAE